MLSEETYADLREFGLENEESQFYITLLKSGPSTVNILGAKLNLERGKAYRILHRLQNLGLVSATFSSPTLCTAVEPQKGLDLLVNKKENEIITMKKLATKIARDLDGLKTTEDEMSQVPSFYIIQGRSTLYGRIARLVEESKEFVYIMTTIEDATRMYHTAIPERIEKACSRGVTINLLVNSCETQSLRQINGLNATEIRIGALPAENRMAILPEKLVISGKMNKSMSLRDEVDSVIYTNSLELVKSMKQFFQSLWDGAKDWK